MDLPTGIDIVFCSEREDVFSLMQRVFFKPGRPLSTHFSVIESFSEDVPIGNAKSDPTKPVAIRIQWYVINSHSIGFWYPITDWVEYNLCSTVLKQKYPNFKQTNLSNAHYDQNTLVEAGHLTAISLKIDELKKTGLGRYSYLDYIPNDKGYCWWVRCPHLEGFGNQVNAQTNTFVV